ncbi:MAG: hypothetical protein EZS28_028358 [Streblomastix strix]|uniref:SH3 domain-containing protein n=1 Tax=Streblomastix strix TaxID=222440 RepID=A0A5J4V0T2_9EUKA|nr:MAG: hypothetical protein EZS28_028358 [Streblomastix strix]
MSETGELFEVISDYSGKEGDKDAISILKGEIVKVVKKELVWFTIEKGGKTGKVPKTKLRACSSSQLTPQSKSTSQPISTINAQPQIQKDNNSGKIITSSPQFKQNSSQITTNIPKLQTTTKQSAQYPLSKVKSQPFIPKHPTTQEKNVQQHQTNEIKDILATTENNSTQIKPTIPQQPSQSNTTQSQSDNKQIRRENLTQDLIIPSIEQLDPNKQQSGTISSNSLQNSSDLNSGIIQDSSTPQTSGQLSYSEKLRMMLERPEYQDFVVVKKLFGGAMGKTFVVRHKPSGQLYVMKRVDYHDAKDKKMADDEIAQMKQLSSRYTVQYFNLFKS